MFQSIAKALRTARQKAQQILMAQRVGRLLAPRPGYNPARRLKRQIMRGEGLSGRQFRIREKQIAREERRPRRGR